LHAVAAELLHRLVAVDGIDRPLVLLAQGVANSVLESKSGRHTAKFKSQNPNHKLVKRIAIFLVIWVL
jgi:hypothetical protein